jgi:4-amino-4-deoxy-L-arabinose transferase-like glycosyltransferase
MRKKILRNLPYIIGAVIILAFFSLRFINLTKLPVFADEAIYIRWSQVMRAEQTLRFLPLSDGKQPLFMWVVIPFFKLFQDPLIAGRMVSVLSGLGTMVGISVLSYLLFKNKKVTLLAAFFYAISPFAFFFDRLSLADSMLSMFGVWTFILSYLALRFKRWDLAMLAGFCLGGAWLTKSPALFFALMIPSLWLFVDWDKSVKKNFSIFIKISALWLVTIFIGYGFYNILRLGPNFHLIASRNMDYVYPLNHIFVSFFDPLKTFLIASVRWIIAMGPWPILIAAVLGFLLNYKKHRSAVLVLLVWFLFPVFVQSEFAKTFTARYIFFSIPYLIIISSSVIIGKFGKWGKVAIYGLLSVFVIVSGIFDYYLLTDPAKAKLPRSERSGYLEEWTAGQGIKETADFLVQEQAVHPEEKIVIGTEGYFGTLPDGLQIYLNRYPEITAIGVGLTFDKVPPPLIGAKAYGDRTYLLVNASRFSGNAEYLGLVKIKEFPKAQKPNGTNDSLLLFEVTNEALKNKVNLEKP